MKIKYFFLLSVVGLSTQIALAEGGDQRPAGDVGVNRRVRTKDNFARVNGEINLQFYLRTVGGRITTRSTPSFYLGGQGIGLAGEDIEVDAGLDYDNGLETGKRGLVSYIARSFANRQERVNPRVWDGSRWQIPPRGRGNEHSLDYEVDTSGRLKLSVDSSTFYWLDNDVNNDGIVDVEPVNTPPSGTTIWPWAAIGQAVIDPATLGQCSVKRVTALTQTPSQAEPEGVLDGTVLRCLFYNGAVHSPDGSRFAWGTAQTSQVRNGSGTGYDAPQSGVLAYDRLWNGHLTPSSDFRVRFPLVQPQKSPAIVGNVPRTNAAESQNGREAGFSRYHRETVVLSLRSSPVGTGTFKY